MTVAALVHSAVGKCRDATKAAQPQEQLLAHLIGGDVGTRPLVQIFDDAHVRRGLFILGGGWLLVGDITPLGRTGATGTYALCPHDTLLKLQRLT